MTHTDILYEKQDGVAWITINRPGGAQRLPHPDGDRADATLSWTRAGTATVGVVVLTGAGDKAFCSGGDQKERGAGGLRGGRSARWTWTRSHSAIRHIPKPVIAMVNGFAIGGGHVLHVLCDLTHRRRHRHLRPDRPARGQRGRRARHRLPGARGRREEGARDLVPVPAVHGPGSARHGAGEQGRAADGAARGGRALVPRSCSRRARPRWRWPSSRSTSTPSSSAGVAQFALTALHLYYQTEEAMEGRNAFVEKRPVNFGRFRS